jgi:hypothetical protein
MTVVFLAVLAGCAGLATATTALTGLSGVSVGNYPERSRGWGFTPTQDIKVTKLGYWAGPGYDTLHYDHIITIYDSAGAVVITGTVVSGEVTSRRENNYAYVDVSDQNVQLNASQDYVIASYWHRTDPSWSDWDVANVSGYSAAGDVITVGQTDLRADGQAMPVDTGTWNNVYLSPNFQFDLVDPGPTNQPPAADAGEDLTIQSAEQDVTILAGAASDPDDDPLQYHWLADGTEIMGWTAVVDGAATLNLEGSQPLGLGAHTLTLEVSDGTDTTSDDMTLMIVNSLPYAQPSATAILVGVGAAFSIETSVADFDGDTVSYTWFQGSDVLASGSAQPPFGGDPVAIAPLAGTGGVAPFTVGSHTLTIVVNDGVNPEQSVLVTVDVQDTAAPTLAPVASETMLWPPNHKLRSVTIQANASDDSGGPVVLTATVASNEPDDGDCFVDSVDSATGVIALRLRSERSGHGDGRVYTVTITATDGSGNASTATVDITVPHDRRKK